MKKPKFAIDAVVTLGADHAAGAVVSPSGVIAAVGDQTFRFPLASVTKIFTAYAALIAWEERTVALDDPAGPAGSTLEHLLSHASGLAPDGPERVLAPPGTERIYSNLGFELLADHVADRAGIPFREYLIESVFLPLEMADAKLDGSPASGIAASLADCVAFVSELLEPTLVAPETLARATTVAFPGLVGVLPGFGRESPCDWGLGFELRDTKSPHWTGAKNSSGTYGHFGQSGSFIWIDPVEALALIVLTDRPFGPWAVEAWPRISDDILGETLR